MKFKLLITLSYHLFVVLSSQALSSGNDEDDSVKHFIKLCEANQLGDAREYYFECIEEYERHLGNANTVQSRAIRYRRYHLWDECLQRSKDLVLIDDDRFDADVQLIRVWLEYSWLSKDMCAREQAFNQACKIYKDVINSLEQYLEHYRSFWLSGDVPMDVDPSGRLYKMEKKARLEENFSRVFVGQ